MIFPPPIGVQFWDSSLRRVKFESEDFRKLGDRKWSNGNREALEHTIGLTFVRLLDVHHYPLIRLVKRFWKLLQCGPDTRWKALPQRVKLTEHPSKPTVISTMSKRHEIATCPYIPSAFSESASTTIFFSSSRHLFIIVSESEYTTELM